MDLGGWVPVLQLVDAQCLYYVCRTVSIHALFAVDMDKTIFNINEISIASSAEQFYSPYLLLRFSRGNSFFDPLLKKVFRQRLRKEANAVDSPFFQRDSLY